MNHLRMHYCRVKDIGLTWDKSTMHKSDEAMQHVVKMSLEGPPRIYLEFIDDGLTPIQSFFILLSSNLLRKNAG